MTLALSMIVRNAASTLPACLKSTDGFVDELCIADTGSTDDTIAIAQHFGARVISIPWNNDFSAARNLALEQVHSDWVLSLDADELLDPLARQALPKLLDNSFDAYQVTIRNYVLSLNERLWDRPAIANITEFEPAKQYPAYVEHQNVRLLRRHPDIFFVGRVHESVGPRILSTNRKLEEANFHIHHFGLAADQATRANKNLLYRDLGRQKIQEMPDNPQAFLELGLVELDNFGDPAEAHRLFARACDLNPKLALAWFFQGVALLRLDQPHESLSCFNRARNRGMNTPILSEFTGDAAYSARQFTIAKENYRAALRLDPENASLLSKLGLTLVRLGKHEQGLTRIRAAVFLHPDLPELHDRLIQGLVAVSLLEDAARAASEKLNSVPHPSDTDFLRAASLWAKLQNWTVASSILHAGILRYPSSLKLRRALTEVEVAAESSKMEQFSSQTPPSS
jgi:tetratricopeptide (TPR) repeat protein